MRKRPRPDPIASILRDFQADLDAGLNIDQACCKAGIGPTTYYRGKALHEDPISSEQFRISELKADVERLMPTSTMGMPPGTGMGSPDRSESGIHSVLRRLA